MSDDGGRDMKKRQGRPAKKASDVIPVPASKNLPSTSRNLAIKEAEKVITSPTARITRGRSRQSAEDADADETNSDAREGENVGSNVEGMGSDGNNENGSSENTESEESADGHGTNGDGVGDEDTRSGGRGAGDLSSAVAPTVEPRTKRGRGRGRPKGRGKGFARKAKDARLETSGLRTAAPSAEFEKSEDDNDEEGEEDFFL